MNMKKAFLLSMLAAPILAAFLVCIHVSLIFYTPYQGDKVTFKIKPGEGFSSINYRLAKRNIISNARIFHYYTKYKDSMTKFKAGTYEITPGLNMGEVLDTFIKGVPILNTVTLPEGKNMYEIGKILESKNITSYDEFIKECRNPKTIANLGIDAPSIEGYLFPETYKFAPQTPASIVVATMLNQFKQQTKNLNLSQGSLTAHEVIILASIVEKETGAKWERPTIAGVYLNRLQKRMRLQADPTTIYGIWENYNGNLRKKHLLQKTPYNTYKIPALPLGPIANPSLAAIKAVLKPEDHRYIYFVSKNDGTHVFTATYKEHLKAVKYFQQNANQRKGKSWRDLKQ
jgi:UPF0755 protein